VFISLLFVGCGKDEKKETKDTRLVGTEWTSFGNNLSTVLRSTVVFISETQYETWITTSSNQGISDSPVTRGNYTLNYPSVTFEGRSFTFTSNTELRANVFVGTGNYRNVYNKR